VVSAVSAVVVVFSTLVFEGQSRVCRAFLMEFNSVKQSSLSRPVGRVCRARPVGIKEKLKEFRIGTASVRRRAILQPDWPDETKFGDSGGLAVVLQGNVSQDSIL